MGHTQIDWVFFHAQRVKYIMRYYYTYPSTSFVVTRDYNIWDLTEMHYLLQVVPKGSIILYH